VAKVVQGFSKRLLATDITTETLRFHAAAQAAASQPQLLRPRAAQPYEKGSVGTKGGKRPTKNINDDDDDDDDDDVYNDSDDDEIFHSAARKVGRDRKVTMELGVEQRSKGCDDRARGRLRIKSGSSRTKKKNRVGWG
jgi:hypothetical protein